MTDRTINWVFRATDKTAQAFRSVDSKLAGITKSLRTFAGFAGFATVAAGLGGLTKSLVEMGGQLQDASDKLGVSAEKLQVLKFAAEQTGSSFDALQTALAFNTKLTGAAARGNKEAAEAFRLLGLDAKKFADLPIDRRLSVIAQQLSNVQDPALRLELTLKALGSGSAELAPLLAQGAGGLAQFERQLRSTNSILSDAQVRALDDAGDAWEAFSLRLRASAAPALTGTISLLEKLAATAKDSRNLTGLIFGEDVERTLRSAQGSDRPGRPGGGRGRGGTTPLTEEESAAISGVPGKKSLEAVRATLAKNDALLDQIIAKGTARAAKAAASQQAILDRVAEITTSNLTPQEEYFAGLDEVAKLQATAGLTAEAASRQVLALGQSYATAEQQQYAATAAGAAYIQALQDIADITREVTTPFEAYGQELDRIAVLQNEFGLGADTAARAVLKAGQDYADAQIAISKGNDELSDSTTRLLQDIKTAADGFARDLTDSFFDSTKSIGEMFEDLAKTIAKALFTQTVTAPLLESILGSASGGGGLLAGLFGRASGGSVGAGRPYVVGEKGPELFVPGSSGRIVPNGGMAPITVNMTITSVDPQTAAQTIAGNERLITNMVRRSMQRAGVRPALA